MKTETTTATDEQLIQSLANATKTYYGCSGHHKAEMNKMFMNSYREELTRRAIEISSNEELLKKGIFNGEGCF